MSTTYEIPEASRAVIIFTEKKSVYAGNDTQTETFVEVDRRSINTDRTSTAIAWARTYRTSWQGFIVMLKGTIVAMETPAPAIERHMMESAQRA